MTSQSIKPIPEIMMLFFMVNFTEIESTDSRTLKPVVVSPRPLVGDFDEVDSINSRKGHLVRNTSLNSKSTKPRISR